MKGISIKLPDETLDRLREEARATGRSVSAMIRDCVEQQRGGAAGSVYDLSADLAGSLRGSRRAATNARRKFRRS